MRPFRLTHDIVLVRQGTIPKGRYYERNSNHITITFPIKSPADAKAIAQELPALMPDFAKAQDAIGTVHYSRFLDLNDERSSSSPTLTANSKSLAEI